MSGVDLIRAPWDPPDDPDPSIPLPERRPRRISEFARMRRPLAEYRAGGRREPDSGVDLPRLPEEYRVAQVRQAVARGWQPWELAALVPAPVTERERAAATGSAA